MTMRSGLPLLAVLMLATAGCVPSDAEIADELSASRREAYLEWKSRRDRGDFPEARLDGPLSLDDAIKIALQYNKQLRAALQNREIARGGRIGSYAVVLPTLNVSGSNSHTEGGRGGYLDNYAAGLTIRQPIYDAAMAPRLVSARLNTALEDEKIREQVQTLIANVANTYYDVLLAYRMMDTHREALASAETQYRMVSEKKKQETATEYDVLRAQVDVATYRASMQTEMNNIDTNRVSLLKLMGASQESEVTFSDKLEFLPMRPVLERAVEIASATRADLRQSELTYRLEQEAVRIAMSEFLPVLGGNYSQSWGESAGGSFGRNPWSIGIGAEYSLGAEKFGGLVQAKARARQAQINILDTQETTVAEIRRHMNTLANAEETVKALAVNQDAASEALRLALVGYQAGVKTEVDVTDARKAMTEVIGNYYQALANHTKARLNLQVAMGVLGPARINDSMPLPPNVPIANIAEFAAADYVPPVPIPMPMSDSRKGGPAPADAKPSAPAPAPPGAGMARANQAPLPASRPVPARAAAVPAPVRPAVVSPAPATASSGPGRTGSGLPIPPELVETKPPAPEAPPVAAAGEPRPLFRITVKNGGNAVPEVARAGR
ncbi:MAG: TolC family protein [Planctomycetota bacterium]|jgi:outer membrane protein TolC|nr:TolC family protein [Planctomycetota bacterium]